MRVHCISDHMIINHCTAWHHTRFFSRLLHFSFRLNTSVHVCSMWFAWPASDNKRMAVKPLDCHSLVTEEMLEACLQSISSQAVWSLTIHSDWLHEWWPTWCWCILWTSCWLPSLCLFRSAQAAAVCFPFAALHLLVPLVWYGRWIWWCNVWWSCHCGGYSQSMLISEGEESDNDSQTQKQNPPNGVKEHFWSMPTHTSD